MIRRLLNHFRRRGLERRGFFCFIAEGRLRAIDPIRAARGLLNDPEFNIETQIPYVLHNLYPETDRATAMVCRAFGLERWSDETGRGLSDYELIDILRRFVAFMDDQKKTTGNGLNSSNSTDSESSIGGPTRPAAADNSPLGSGSMPIESTTGSPGEPSGELNPESTGPMVAN